MRSAEVVRQAISFSSKELKHTKIALYLHKRKSGAQSSRATRFDAHFITQVSLGANCDWELVRGGKMLIAPCAPAHHLERW